MKNVKYTILGILITLSALFVFLNQTPMQIDFLFTEITINVSTAIIIAFFLGLFSGVLIVLLRRAMKKELTPEQIARKKMNKEAADEIHGIPLK